MRHRFLGSLPFVLLIVVAACGGTGTNGTSPPRPEASAASERKPAHAERAAETVEVSGCRAKAELTGRRLVGDIDGDGRSDEAAIAVDRRRSMDCRYFLVVKTGTGTKTAPIRQSEVQPVLDPPVLDSLVPIDSRPGFEVVVEIWTGASTGSLGMFTLGSKSLVRVQLVRGGRFEDR